MADTLNTAHRLKETARLAKELSTSISKACGGSFEWSVDQLVDSYISMYERFCPFDIGDRVALVADVDTSNAPGWDHCKHFLIKGAKGTVNDRGYSNGFFTFDVMFDDESWLKDGIPQPIINNHTFGFNENKLMQVAD